MSDSAMEDIVMSGISPSPLLAMPAEIQLQILRYLLSTSHNRKAARRPVDAPCNHHLEDILSDPAGQNSTDAVMRLFHPVASSTSGVIPVESKVVSSCCLEVQVLQTCSRLYDVGCRVLYEENKFVAIRSQVRGFVEELSDYGIGALWGPFRYDGKLQYRSVKQQGLEGEPEWQVKRIVDCKNDTEHGFLYRVAWTGSYEETWEPPSHLNCDELVNAFHLKHPNKPKPEVRLSGTRIKELGSVPADKSLGLSGHTCTVPPLAMEIDSTQGEPSTRRPRPFRQIEPVLSLFMRLEKGRGRRPDFTDAAVLVLIEDCRELWRAVWLTMHRRATTSRPVQLRWDGRANISSRLLEDYTKSSFQMLSLWFDSDLTDPQASKIPLSFDYARVYKTLKASESIALGFIKTKQHRKGEAVLYSLLGQVMDVIIVKNDGMRLQHPSIGRAYCTLVSHVAYHLVSLYTHSMLVQHLGQPLDVLTMTSGALAALCSVLDRQPPQSAAAKQLRARLIFMMANMWAQTGHKEDCQRYLRRGMLLSSNGNEAMSKKLLDDVDSMVAAYEAHRNPSFDAVGGSRFPKEPFVEEHARSPKTRFAGVMEHLDSIRASVCDSVKENTLALVTFYVTEGLSQSLKPVS
jgi:hypothetical protein